MESTPISSLPEAVSVGSSDLMVILQSGVTKKATAQVLADLVEVPTVTVSWDEVTSKPTTFAPSAHTHTVSEISDYPTFATVATSGAYADLSGLPTLGTAAALAVGTGANEVVQLDGSGLLPAVDGSQLVNLPASGVSTGKAIAMAIVFGG